jgi:uncharacterized SAM-binding protein YcdF (DUF218 family)
VDFFDPSKFFDPVFQAGNLLAILVIVIFVICATSRRALIRNSAIVGAVIVAILLLLPLGAWALAPLERRFPQPQLPSSVDGILVLGGGAENPERFLALAPLARHFPQARVVFSDIDANAGRIGFRQLGLDPARTMIEDRARNTWENLNFTYVLVKPRMSEKWLIVTGAYHIPRTMGVAGKLRWPLIPWPAGYHAGPAKISLQFTDNLDKLETAGHEWVGLLAYWMMGRSDQLFPQPVS